MRSNLHAVTCHDGTCWLDDILVEGDPSQTVVDLLGGLPNRERDLIPGVSKAFYRDARTALVLTFDATVDRERAEQIMLDIKENRDDTN